MDSIFNETVKKSVKYWYLLALVGVIFIVIGGYTLSNPLESYLSLSLIFSWSFLITGFFELSASLANRKRINNWGWILVSGVVNVAIGFLLLVRPEISITILPLFVGFFMLFRAVAAIGYAIELRRGGTQGWGWSIFLGILGFLFSLGLIANPSIAGMTLVIWTGLAFISIGVFQIYFSLQLKRLR